MGSEISASGVGVTVHRLSWGFRIGAACGSDPVGSVSSLIEWGLEHGTGVLCRCVALLVGSRGRWVTQATGGTASRHGTKGARGAVEGCGLFGPVSCVRLDACTDYRATVTVLPSCTVQACTYAHTHTRDMGKATSFTRSSRQELPLP